MPVHDYTLLDLSNQIVSFFINHSVFSRDEFLGINAPEGMDKVRDDLVIAALTQLEESGFIRQVGKDQNLWILARPIGMAGQDIHLSMNASAAVADTINTFVMANGSNGKW